MSILPIPDLRVGQYRINQARDDAARRRFRNRQNDRIAFFTGVTDAVGPGSGHFRPLLRGRPSRADSPQGGLAIELARAQGQGGIT